MSALTRRMILTLPLLASRVEAQPADGRTALRSLVEGGTVAFIPHAHADGTVDPPGFALGDCRTQRNLDEAGREQAAELGLKLREAGALITQVRSSRWCIALDTAALAFPNMPLTPEANLDPAAALDRESLRRIGRLISRWNGRQGTLALVSHPSTIAAATGVTVTAGQIVAIQPRPFGFSVVGVWA